MKQLSMDELLHLYFFEPYEEKVLAEMQGSVVHSYTASSWAVIQGKPPDDFPGGLMTNKHEAQDNLAYCRRLERDYPDMKSVKGARVVRAKEIVKVGNGRIDWQQYFQVDDKWVKGYRFQCEGRLGEKGE